MEVVGWGCDGAACEVEEPDLCLLREIDLHDLHFNSNREGFREKERGSHRERGRDLVVRRRKKEGTEIVGIWNVKKKKKGERRIWKVKKKEKGL